MPRAIQHGVARIGATMAQQLRRQILKEPQSAWVSLRNSTGSEAFRPLRPPQSLAFASITCFGVGSAGYSFLMYLVNFARPVASEQRPQPMCSALISGVPGDDRKGHVTTAMQWTPRAIIAVLRDVDPCPGLPHCARHPRPAECRPKFFRPLRGERAGDCGRSSSVQPRPTGSTFVRTA